jgi:protease-4
MTLTADNLLDRMKLKKSVTKWRTIAILMITIILVLLADSGNFGVGAPADHIARISIDGVIFEDQDRDKMLETIKEDANAKAVIVYINSPGGTIVGGENLYYTLREIAAVKPVVAVMGSLAASGGYMAAIAADHIVARGGTLTGSVGVLMQSFDVTELGKKVGVGFETFKSGHLKASPSPFEKTDAEVRKLINESIADSFDLFMSMVVERRALSQNEVNIIKDGRVLTGRQALKLNLVDEIGGQEEAIKWLQDSKGVSKKLKVKDVKLDSEKNFIEKLVSKVSNSPFSELKNGGLLAMWNQ